MVEVDTLFIDNKGVCSMKKNKKNVIGLFILFPVLLGTTVFVSFSTLLEEDEIVIKSMTPVYDETVVKINVLI